jgi:flagellar biogenesis protein FliO
MGLVMSRRRRSTLRARICVAIAVGFPSLALADESPFYPAPGAASSTASLTDVPPVTVDDSDRNRITRRITPRGETSDDDGSERSRLPNAGSVLSALALVTLAIFAVARLWKLHGPKLAVGAPPSAAQVLGRCRIDSKQSLFLVRIGSRILVLGSANGELTMLSEITAAAEVDLISAQCQSGGGAASPFSHLFAARQVAEADAARSPDAPPTPFAARPTFGTAERRLAERFRGQSSEQESGRAA